MLYLLRLDGRLGTRLNGAVTCPVCATQANNYMTDEHYHKKGKPNTLLLSALIWLRD